MAKIIVTGANGFLGSWVTRALVAEGHSTYALVRQNSDLSELMGVDCQLLYGDVTDIESLRKNFKGMDSVFHLAGVVAYKKADRALMEQVNVQGTINVVQTCESEQVRRLVHLSSVVAVGAAFDNKTVLNESSTFNLSHLNLGYFETKKKAEEIVLGASQSKKIDAVALNPSTIYGAGDAKKGSRKTQLKVARGEFPFYTSGGVNVVAVEDVVAGILAGWKKGRTSERYILCGENLYIKDLFSLIAKQAGVPAPKYMLPKIALHTMGTIGDLVTSFGLGSSISRENAWTSTLYHWFDSSKARAELDFKPSSAEAAISKSVGWMREQGYLKS